MRFVNFYDQEDCSKLAFQPVCGHDFYPSSLACQHCKDKSAMLIGVVDDVPGKELCKRTRPPEMKYWPHDSMSIALYLCGECLQVTAKFTQA